MEAEDENIILLLDSLPIFDLMVTKTLKSHVLPQILLRTNMNEQKIISYN